MAIAVNPENAYHWLSIKATVVREVSDDDPQEGRRVTDHIDKMWAKYIQTPGGYSLHDPSREDRRILFELRVDSVATFGRP